MKARDINVVLAKYRAMSAEIDTLSNLMNKMLDAGLADSSEYKKVNGKFRMTCGAVQALQWAVEIRDEFNFND